MLPFTGLIFFIGVVVGCFVVLFASDVSIGKYKGDRIEIKNVPDPFEGKVKCNGCYCLLNKCDAQEVLAPMNTFYYCGACTKPYERMLWNPDGSGFRYYRMVQVDINGVPVDYIPKKK